MGVLERIDEALNVSTKGTLTGDTHDRDEAVWNNALAPMQAGKTPWTANARKVAKKISEMLGESAEHPMIDVDGAQKHRHNSEGRPIHHTDDGIRNFHRWFGDSAVVDQHGRPKVMYHGSTEHFTNFDAGEFGFHVGDASAAEMFGDTKRLYVAAKNPFLIQKDLGDWKPEVLLSWLRARTYKGPGTGVSEQEGAAARKATARLRKNNASALDNDSDMRAQRKALYAIGEPVRALFEKRGYDAIKYTNEGEGGDSYIALRPHQLKSADLNSGQFSARSPHIGEATARH